MVAMRRVAEDVFSFDDAKVDDSFLDALAKKLQRLRKLMRRAETLECSVPAAGLASPHLVTLAAMGDEDTTATVLNRSGPDLHGIRPHHHGADRL